MTYQLVARKPSLKHAFVLTIKADANDGDIRTATTGFTKEAFERAFPEIKNLNEQFSGEEQLTGYDNPLEFNIPYNGYDGYCHTIESIAIEHIDRDSKIWDVQL